MSEVRRHTRGGKRWVLDENNGDRLLGMVEKKGYCRYEGENIQRCLEGSRLNMTSRIDQDVGAEREEMGARGQERSRSRASPELEGKWKPHP